MWSWKNYDIYDLVCLMFYYCTTLFQEYIDHEGHEKKEKPLLVLDKIINEAAEFLNKIESGGLVTKCKCGNECNKKYTIEMVYNIPDECTCVLGPLFALSHFMRQDQKYLGMIMNEEHVIFSFTLYYELWNRKKGGMINNENYMRVIIITLLISEKILTDTPIFMSSFAKLTTPPMENINLMEVEFLKLLNWEMPYNTYHEIIAELKKIKYGEFEEYNNWAVALAQKSFNE